MLCQEASWPLCHRILVDQPYLDEPVATAGLGVEPPADVTRRTSAVANTPRLSKSYTPARTWPARISDRVPHRVGAYVRQVVEVTSADPIQAAETVGELHQVGDLLYERAEHAEAVGPVSCSGTAGRASSDTLARTVRQTERQAAPSVAPVERRRYPTGDCSPRPQWVSAPASSGRTRPGTP